MKRLGWSTQCILVMCAACASTQSAVVYEALPEPTSLAEGHFFDGIREGREGHWDKAAKKFEEARALDAGLVGASVNLAIAYERIGQPQKSIDVYRQLIAQRPNEVRYAVELGRLYVLASSFQEGRQLLEAAQAKEPENPVVLLGLASVLRHQKEFDKAAQLARKVVLREQKNIAAIKTLALIYVDQGKLELAETFFFNALKLAPEDASIQNNLGLIAFRRGEHQVAIGRFETALKQDPNSALAHANLGAISLRFRDYGRARAAYEKAIALGIVTCETQSALGYALEGLQQGEAAVAELGKAQTLCPSTVGLLYDRGNICMTQLRDNRCALEYFSQFITTSKELAKDHPVFQAVHSLKQSAAPAPEPTPADSGEAPKSEGGGESGAPAALAPMSSSGGSMVVAPSK